MRLLHLAFRAAAFTLLLGGAAAAAPSPVGKTYYLDAYDKGKDPHAGPVKTAKLAKDVPYVAIVRGTFSFFGSRDLRADFCGQPEPKPIYRTKKRKNGYVAGDAEWLFADLKQNCSKRGGQLVITNFQFRTAKKWTNPVPVGGQPAGPNSSHRYRYPLIGAGKKVRVRLYDALTKDNYGRLRIHYRRAKASDCANGKFASWYYADETSCVTATTGVPVTPAPTPTPTPTSTPTPPVQP